MHRRKFCIGLISVLAITSGHAAESRKATLYKTPECSCCEGYAAYLRENGFEVDVKATSDLSEVSRKAGVPAKLQGCHTVFVDGYVVDGHVPVNIIRKMLSERPAIAGITLPGMPQGSPGMTGRKTGAFTVYAVFKDKTTPKVYAVE